MQHRTRDSRNVTVALFLVLGCGPVALFFALGVGPVALFLGVRVCDCLGHWAAVAQFLPLGVGPVALFLALGVGHVAWFLPFIRPPASIVCTFSVTTPR